MHVVSFPYVQTRLQLYSVYISSYLASGSFLELLESATSIIISLNYIKSGRLCKRIHKILRLPRQCFKEFCRT